MDKRTRQLADALRLAHKLLVGTLTDTQLDFVHADGSTARGKISTIEKALKSAAAEAPRLAWTRDGGTYVCRVGDHEYAVFENGNEPARSTIRWVATCDNKWLGDGEPRCADAKLLCYRHAQRAAGVAT